MRWFIAAAMLLCGSLTASAQGCLIIMVGFAAGGTTDVIGRTLADSIGKELGAPCVVIENKAGASGILAADVVKNADARTILLTPDFTLAITPHMPEFRENPRYGITDFLPLAIAAKYHSGLIVRGDSPLRSVDDYVAATAKDPTRGDFATTGYGSMSHLLMQDLLQQIQKKGTTLAPKHVPHKGVAPAMLSVLGGHVPVASLTLSEALPRIADGSIRMLCLFAQQRSHFAPQIPTCTEAGYPVAQDGWFGFVASARTSAGDVMRISNAIRAAVRKHRDALHALGLETADVDPIEFHRLLVADHERLGRIVRSLQPQ